MTSATANATLERAIAWFDIPSLDFDRAIRFYETVLQTTLQRAVIGGVPMATFDRDASSTGGSIVFDPQQMKPSANGVLVYLNAGESVVAALERAKRAGGVVQAGRRAAEQLRLRRLPDRHGRQPRRPARAEMPLNAAAVGCAALSSRSPHCRWIRGVPS